MHKQTGNDRLVNLHTRLNHEAEKIAQWKVSTEIELHQKEKLLEESEQTIKALRQTLLDVQLQNENLSLKIQEEINHRDEMEQRMVTTREMYAFLKTHIETIEDRLMKCEEDRTELKYLDKERIEQFEDLSSQFTKLEITQFEKHQEILDKCKQVILLHKTYRIVKCQF
ncbi:PREDICTED: uncharacterized protein LOC106815448 [Priapulus caudatus]|uniref:Uncharacterized protein LOC106815448 n=1 Tax=Priapulus caudatus TaxID=37621 RepID=A0ABM1ET71_PRICU|nr:PREDICTED: uncharacterized protein LOC106815448 [Priapulus caudatus]